MKGYFLLSKKEMELMELFWDAGCPLARAEILERAENRQCSWKPNSVHILVNSLLDKGALQVAGYYLNSRKLGRTFEPALSRQDYALMQVAQAADNAHEVGLKSPSLISALVGDGKPDTGEIDEMLTILEDLKKGSKKRK